MLGFYYFSSFLVENYTLKTIIILYYSLPKYSTSELYDISIYKAAEEI